MSRELGAYKDLPAAGRAAMQLEAAGKHVRPGQRVRFLLLRGHRNVHAWDLPGKPDPRALDYARYAELTIRAASNIFTLLGISEETLSNLVLERGRDMEFESKQSSRLHKRQEYAGGLPQYNLNCSNLITSGYA
jgi:DNA polymerase elongation subunit (family B)